MYRFKSTQCSKFNFNEIDKYTNNIHMMKIDAVEEVLNNIDE